MTDRVDLEEALAAVASLSAELPRGLWAMAAIRLATIQRVLKEAKAELTELRQALTDWELVKSEPVVVGRLAVIKAAKPKRMMGIGRFPITPVTADDDRLPIPPEAT